MHRDVFKELGRKRDSVRAATVSVRGNQVAHDSRNHAVDESGGKLGGPLADRRTSATDTLADSIGVAAKQSEGSSFLHGADDLTTRKPARQTSGHASANRQAESTSADVRQRPLASAESRLIDRLDKAMKVAGVTGPKLAQALGITPQSLTNMRRKAKAGMRAELLAHAADFLQCDLHWLCTGEGGDYVPARNLRKLIAAEYVAWLAELSDDDLLRAFAMVTNLRQGIWPPAN